MDPVFARVEWFEKLVLPHEGALRELLRRMLRSEADADDMVAEALLRAYSVEDWTKVTAGRAYLFTIGRNLVIDQARKGKVVSVHLLADIELLQADRSTESGLEARDELRQVQKAVEALPIQCRRVFVLRRIHGWSIGEIADEMAISVSTVEKHLVKGVSRVMKALSEQQDGSDRSPVARTRERKEAK